MAQEISYQNDATGSDERARGSDNRLNVSSRSDSRSYYNSRDNSAAFSLSWDDTSSAAGDLFCTGRIQTQQVRSLSYIKACLTQ